MDSGCGLLLFANNSLTAIHCLILLPLQKIDTVAALQFTDPFSNGSLFAYIVVKMRPLCVPWPHAGTSLDEQAAVGGSSAAATAHRAIAGRSHCGLCDRLRSSCSITSECIFMIVRIHGALWLASFSSIFV
jgi:hypothetical protein